jgi:hypothetical protein
MCKVIEKNLWRESEILFQADVKIREKAAICSIVVNEELYLDEFVNYHRALGFERFFVYDNTAGFEMKQWGKLKGDYVQVIHFPGKAKQYAAYTDCARRAKAAGIFKWVAFFDIDEFLVLKKHGHVSDMLEDHCKSGALAVNWLVFDNSGWNIPFSEPVTKRFLYRFNVSSPRNNGIKTIARVSHVKEFRSPHFAILEEGFVARDSNGTQVNGPRNENKPTDVVVLHHYHAKSFKEFVQKRMRGRSGKDTPELTEERILEANKTFFEALSREEPLVLLDRVFDDSAWQFLKHAVPGYAGFDEFSLSSVNVSNTYTTDTGQP